MNRRDLFRIAPSYLAVGLCCWLACCASIPTMASANEHAKSTETGGAAQPTGSSPKVVEEPDATETPAAKPKAAWGTVRGRFLFDGQPPPPKPIEINRDKNALAGVLLFDRSLVVGDDGGIANVVIWVRTKDVAIHPDYEKLRDEQVGIIGVNGQFEPRIVPYWTGQPWRFENRSPFAYNFNVQTQINAPVNHVFPSNRAHDFKPLERAEVLPVSLSCNIHPWIKSWLVVQPHPYVAVSGEDGRFELKNLPAGVQMELQVWHERNGYVTRAEINDRLTDWPRGRFTVNLRKDELLDFGPIKLEPERFGELAVREVKQVAPASDRAAAQAGESAEAPAANAAEPPAPNANDVRSESPADRARGGFGTTRTSRFPERTEAELQAAAEMRRSANKEVDQASKLLVGAWRGGHADGLIIFREGGVYEEHPRTLTPAHDDAEAPSARGTWHTRLGPVGSSRASGATWETTERGMMLVLTPDSRAVQLRGLPNLAQVDRFIPVDSMQIVHLDERFLRISRASRGRGNDAPSPAYFFRREEDQPAVQDVISKLPELTRRLAILAELSPDHAKALAATDVEWLKQWNVSEAQLKQLERLAAAHQGKIDLAELFELAAEEANAFAGLYQLTAGNFKKMQELAEKEQLTEVEIVAVKKLVNAEAEIIDAVHAISEGVAAAGNGEQLDDATMKALQAVADRAAKLHAFAESTAFNQPEPRRWPVRQ